MYNLIFVGSIVLISLVLLNTRTYTPKVNYGLFIAIQFLSSSLILVSLVKYFSK